MPDAYSFTKKQLEIRLTLRQGDFGDKGNTKSIKGLATKAKIEKTGPPDFCKATIEICGLKYEDIERFSTLSFKPLTTAKNIIEVLAGSEEEGMSLAFKGEITTAAADFNGSPDVWMKFEAIAGYYGEVSAQGPSAIKGSQSAASFIESQAKKMGYAFKNEGVKTQLNNAVFNGSPMEQARSAARQVGAELLLDDGVLILTPSGGVKKGNAVLLNKNTGLLGYPTITNEGVEISALYNPAFKLGGYIKLESIVPKATGEWRIVKLSHELNAFCTGGGPWKSKMTLFLPNEEPPKKSSSSKSK